LAKKKKTFKKMVRINVMVFNGAFVAVSFIGGGNHSTRKKSLTCHKSLIAYVVVNPTTIRSRWTPHLKNKINLPYNNI
jgi:hypothetical protein